MQSKWLDVGFLREPERVNVLLSRARLGEIIVGCAKTLRAASDRGGRALWTALLDRMVSKGQVHEGLPARCERHATTPPALLATTAAFERFCKTRRVPAHLPSSAQVRPRLPALLSRLGSEARTRQVRDAGRRALRRRSHDRAALLL